MRMRLLLASSAVALGAALALAPTAAAAQSICELNGTNTGLGATANGPGSMACGQSADAGLAGDNFATAIGVEAQATATEATAIGSFVNWSSPVTPGTVGVQSVAIGSTTQASATNAIAIGVGSVADFANSIVIAGEALPQWLTEDWPSGAA